MKLNIVPARTGIQWVKLGIQTFFRQPLALSGLFFMFMAVMSLASMVPLIGSALALALLPAATLGLMAATQEATRGKFPMPSILITAFRAGQQRLQAMLVLGALYALGFLVVMGVSALFDGGKFARLYLVGGQITRELAAGPELPERHVGCHGAVPAAVAAVLACAGAGALARRAAPQEPVLQLGGLHAQLQGIHAVRPGLGGRVPVRWPRHHGVCRADRQPAGRGMAMVPGALLMAAMFFTSFFHVPRQLCGG
jgi:hypothetical protein